MYDLPPKAYDPSQPMVFQHIPKCAGTSVRKIFSRWFGEHLYGHYFDNLTSTPPTKVDLIEAQAKAASNGGAVCVFGHFNGSRGFGYRDYYPEVAQILTIIRDPFEHHISNYYFAKKKVAAGKFDLPLARLLKDHNMGVEEYLTSHQSYLGSFFPSEMDEKNYPEKLRDEFLFIGITERLNESILDLAQLLRKPKCRVPRENVSTRDDGVSSAKFRALFEKKNEFVCEVYRECGVIFEERRRKSFRERLFKRFRSRGA